LLSRVLEAHNETPITLGPILTDFPAALDEQQGQALPLAPLRPPHSIQQAHERERLAPIDTQDIIDTVRQHLEQRYELKPKEPNLDWLHAEEIAAHIDENGVIVVGEGAETFKAILAPCHNNPNTNPPRVVGNTDSLSAQLTYRFFDGKYPLPIKRGAWLNEQDSSVVIEVNKTRYLILAIVEGKDKRMCAIRRDFDSSYRRVEIQREELDGDVFGINVRLISDSGGRLLNESNWMLEVKREPEFQVLLLTAYWWRKLRLMGFWREGVEFQLKIGSDLANEKQIETEIAGAVQDWETRAANFIGKYLDEEKKKEFLNCIPSIEAGLQHSPSGPSLFGRLNFLGQTAPKKEFRPDNWSLYYSINARVEKIEAFS
jgi:hypothetical protein